MKIYRLPLLLLVSLTLSQCEAPLGQIDSRNPTIAEQDALDVQWGLEPRKSRGNSRRFISNDLMRAVDGPSAAVPAPAPAPAASPAPAAAAPAPAAPAAPASTTVDPALLDKLR